eukprot:6269383-Prymnesium_polylepis.1
MHSARNFTLSSPNGTPVVPLPAMPGLSITVCPSWRSRRHKNASSKLAVGFSVTSTKPAPRRGFR